MVLELSKNQPLRGSFTVNPAQVPARLREAGPDGKKIISATQNQMISPGVGRQVAKVLPAVPPHWR